MPPIISQHAMTHSLMLLDSFSPLTTFYICLMKNFRPSSQLISLRHILDVLKALPIFLSLVYHSFTLSPYGSLPSFIHSRYLIVLYSASSTKLYWKIFTSFEKALLSLHRDWNLASKKVVLATCRSPCLT